MSILLTSLLTQGQKPEPVYLRPGDRMALGIEGLGQQNQTVHAWDPALIDG